MAREVKVMFETMPNLQQVVVECLFAHAQFLCCLQGRESAHDPAAVLIIFEDTYIQLAPLNEAVDDLAY